MRARGAGAQRKRWLERGRVRHGRCGCVCDKTLLTAGWHGFIRDRWVWRLGIAANQSQRSWLRNEAVSFRENAHCAECMRQKKNCVQTRVVCVHAPAEILPAHWFSQIPTGFMPPAMNLTLTRGNECDMPDMHVTRAENIHAA
eukprot:IDg21581t1